MGWHVGSLSQQSTGGQSYPKWMRVVGMDVARSSTAEKDIVLQFPHLDCIEASHFLWRKAEEQWDTSSVEFHIGLFSIFFSSITLNKK
jgi:hypothetical protein